MRTARALLVAAVAVVGVVVGGRAAAQGGVPGGVGVAPLALPPPSVSSPKAAPLYPRLDGGLNRALAAEGALVEAERLGYRVRDGRVQVYVVVEDGELERVRTWLEDNDAAFASSAYDIV